MIMNDWEPALTKEECNNSELGACYCGECKREGLEMSYEPPLNDPVFEDEEEELSPEFDTVEEMEVPE